MQEEQSRFWSAVADKYDRVVDLQIGPRTRALVRDRLAREPLAGNIVEFGCGTGFFTEVLAGKATSLLATDISPGMLELARRRLGPAPNVKFAVEDVQATSLTAGAFDVVFMSLVLHFTQPAKTLAEMHRILRSGGTLILTNLDFAALKGFARMRAGTRIFLRGVTGYRLKPPANFTPGMMGERELLALLPKHGFSVLGSETISDASRSSNIPINFVRAVKV